MSFPSFPPQTFFSLEGLDGSGKSTQLSLLEAALRSGRHNTLCVREPGGTPLSSRIREILLAPEHGEMAPMTELFLYSAARAQLVHQVIKPALQKNTVVLADRFGWSTLAYQGYGRGMNRSIIESLLRDACGDVWPMHSFLLDIPPEGMQTRLATEGRNLDRMERENLEFFQRVREGYLVLAKENRESFTVLDAMQNREILHQTILAKIQSCLKAVNRPTS